MQDFLELVRNYLEYCEYCEKGKANREIDLSKAKWFYPTTLLPLGNFIKEHKDTIKCVPPVNKDAASYFHLMLDEHRFEAAHDGYCPIVRLPEEHAKADKILEKLYKLQDQGRGLGGETAFKYIIGELVTNIYEHSGFTNAMIMAQSYPKQGFVDICLFDNGISIPGSFEKYDLKFGKDWAAIADAVNGLSTKASKERGYGLGSSLKIVLEGLNGEVFVVSRNGGIYTKEKNQVGYELSKVHRLHGTLVSIRIPFSTNVVNIYDYLK